ncbi:MAG: LLM class flavin-dependent oxidoreductase [Dehalococcoidia bacterium]
MGRILTCTWAPTALTGPQLLFGAPRPSPLAALSGPELRERLLGPVRSAEALGVDFLLVAQRWWGTGVEIEAATFDCFAMTAFYAAHTERVRLITAVHPGFVLPAVAAKWGATIDRLTGGRWAINVTSGWHEQEFGMFGATLIPHDERYERSGEFVDVLRGAWAGGPSSFRGRYYEVDGLIIDPPPSGPLTVFQGGQSDAALAMAAERSDWMFLNGGRPAKIGGIIERARAAAVARGRTLQFALYAIPLCRPTDAEAEAVVEAMVEARDPAKLAARRSRVAGAEGMWAPSDDPLTALDSNEGFASRLIGSPETIYQRILAFHRMGVDCFHMPLFDPLFVSEVLPRLREAHAD